MPHDDLGREIPDPTPVSLPAGFQRPEPLAETIRRLVRNEVSRQAVDSGMESFEESLDFDIDDEELPESPSEARATMQEELLDETHIDRLNQIVEARKRQKPPIDRDAVPRRKPRVEPEKPPANSEQDPEELPED